MRKISKVYGLKKLINQLEDEEKQLRGKGYYANEQAFFRHVLLMLQRFELIEKKIDKLQRDVDFYIKHEELD